MPFSMQGPSGSGFEAWLAALVVDAALKGTVVLLMAWVATLALRQTSAAIRHFVWCLAFVGLAALPVLSAALPAWQVPGLKEVVDKFSAPASESKSPQVAEVAAPSNTSTANLADHKRGAAGSGSALVMSRRDSSGSLSRAQVTVSDAVSPERIAPRLSWRRGVPRFWLLGVIAALVPLAAGLVGQRWLTRRVRRLGDRAWLEPLEELRRYFRIWRPISLCVSTRSVGPLTLGVFQPVVLIPAEAREWQLERRRVVILHELAHIRRYDVLTQICAQIVCAVYWFHPLVWVAAKRMRTERETACDDLVLNAGVRASTYAQHLLEIACKARRTVLPAAAVAGMPCGSRLETRVTTILDAGRERRPMTFTAIVAAIAFTFAAVAAVASAGIEPAAESAPNRQRLVVKESLLTALAQHVTPVQNHAIHATAVVTMAAGPQPSRVLPGFLPAPGARSGVERWQMITATPRGNIWAVAWRPDGKQVAFGEGANVRVHDAATFEPARILIGHSGRITSIRWSRDSKRIASSSSDGTVRLWNEDGSPGPVLESGGGAVRCVAWNPDGKHVAGACADGLVHIWNVDGTPEKSLRGHEAPVNAVAWSPDGQHIASGCDNRTVRVWNADGTPGAVMEGHSGAVLSISWSPDGNQLASSDFGFDAGNGDEEHSSSVRLWTVDGKEGPAFIGENNGQTNSVEWSPDGKWIAFAGWDSIVHLRSADGRQMRNLDGSSFCIYSIAWSPDSTRIISGSQQLNSRAPAQLLTWHLDGTATKSLQSGGNGIFSVAWSPDGTQFAAASRDGKVRVWDASGKMLQTLTAGAYDIYGVEWSPDGKKLAAVCRDDRTLKIWNAGTWKEETSFVYTSNLRSLAWSPDSKTVAVASDNRVAFTFDPATKTSTEFTGFHKHGVTCVAWNPAGTQIASGSFDSRVRLWNRDGSTSADLEDFSAPVRALAWSPDGKHLVTGREDNNLRLWDTDGTGGAMLSGHEGYVQSVAWSPDGKHIASGSWDNTIRFWNPDGTPEKVLRGHGASIFSVAWRADSQKLLSASFDGTIRLWNAGSGESEFSVVLREDGASATVSAVGELIAGDSAVIDSEFVYLVETPAGSFEILKPVDFQKRTSQAK